MKAKVVNYYTVKGGPGKSALNFLSGSIIANQGYKTVLLDFDPQQTNTKRLKQISNFEIGEKKTAFEFLMGDENLSDCLIETKSNLFLLPGNIRLLKIQESINENYIKQVIAELKGFDFIFIDNQSTWNSIIRSGIIASDLLVIPTQLSQSDLDEAVFSLEESKRINPALNIKLLVTRVKNPEKLSKKDEDYLQSYREFFNGRILNSKMPESTYVRDYIDRNDPLIGKEHIKFKNQVRLIMEEISGLKLKSDVF